MTKKKKPAAKSAQYSNKALVRAARMAHIPESVTILGMGPSLELYVDHIKRRGGRRANDDELWGINALGDIFNCDRIFHMDDVRVQELRAAAMPKSNIATMVEWMKGADLTAPIITSRAHPDYPSLVEFPLQDVINNTGGAYFNNTGAYAVAYAVFLGVKRINIFGFDYTYQNAHHAESGRACVEYWIGFGKARGIEFKIPETSTLLGMADKSYENFYGYDCVDVNIDVVDQRAVVTFDEKDPPTAEEIEKRYDHNRHPNKLVRDQNEAV